MNIQNQLSHTEQQFFESLQKVDADSIWGLAISNVCAKPDVPKIRRLVADLKSQAHDNEPVMISILGETCYTQLKNLSL